MSKKATEFQRKEIEENKVDIGCAVLPAWLSCPLPAAFSGSPLRGHRHVFNADGHAVFKVRC